MTVYDGRVLPVAFFQPQEMIPYDERLENAMNRQVFGASSREFGRLDDGSLALQDFVNARLTLLEIESKLKGLYYDYQWNGLKEKLQGTIYIYIYIYIHIYTYIYTYIYI